MLDEKITVKTGVLKWHQSVLIEDPTLRYYNYTLEFERNTKEC